MAPSSFTWFGRLSIGSFLSFAVILCPGVTAKNIFCYYSSFAYTREGRGNFLPEDINPHLCTHIIYAFVNISPDGKDLVPFSDNDQGPKGLYARTLALKEKNPKLKVLLAVGGWLIGSEPFLPVVRTDVSRAVWVRSVVNYLRRHGFDGFDMDWEFPATRGSPPQDKVRFTKLMKGLYEAFDKESKESGKEKLILTMATASGTYYINQSYEPRKIVRYLDYMLLMTYNYHGQWEKTTGHHSGLYPHRNDPKQGEKSQLYQEWSIDFWLDAGMPKEKLIVGIPTYAMTFTLSDPSRHGIRAPAVSGGKQGEFTQETGILANYEVCDRLKTKGWQAEWIEEQGVPFAYGGDQWAGFENKRSVTLKAKNILKRDLGGAFVWSVEMDDFDGFCGQGPYPLLQAINDVISLGSPSRSASKSIQSPAKSKPNKHQNHGLQVNHAARKKIKHRPSKTDRSAKDYRFYNKLTFKTKPTSGSLHDRGRLQEEEEEEDDKSQTKLTSSPSRPRPAVTPGASRPPGRDVDILGLDRQGKKILWRPGDPSLRRRIRVSPRRTDDPREDSKRFHSVTSISQKLALKEAALKETETKRMDTQEPSWWFKRSPLPPTTGWTKTIPKRRKLSSSRSNVRAQETTLVPMTHPRELKGRYSLDLGERKQASASAASGKLNCRAMGVGMFPHPRSCDHYVICQAGSWSNLPTHVMSCPAGTRFDAQLKICNFASLVEC